jgi:hypothetical protein
MRLHPDNGHSLEVRRGRASEAEQGRAKIADSASRHGKHSAHSFTLPVHVPGPEGCRAASMPPLLPLTVPFILPGPPTPGATRLRGCGSRFPPGLYMASIPRSSGHCEAARTIRRHHQDTRPPTNASSRGTVTTVVFLRAFVLPRRDRVLRTGSATPPAPGAPRYVSLADQTECLLHRRERTDRGVE